jgi:hypothetical protein
VVLPQLRRVRWAVRATLLLGVAASVLANILHALHNPISQAIAAWPPIALLLTVELISRVPVHRRLLAAARVMATATIAGIAAWVSYWHMAGVAARYGETGASPYLLPLSVDGLIVVASICLVELGGRIAALEQPAGAHIMVDVHPAQKSQPARRAQPAVAQPAVAQPAVAQHQAEAQPGRKVRRQASAQPGRKVQHGAEDQPARKVQHEAEDQPARKVRHQAEGQSSRKVQPSVRGQSAVNGQPAVEDQLSVTPQPTEKNQPTGAGSGRSQAGVVTFNPTMTRGAGVAPRLGAPAQRRATSATRGSASGNTGTAHAGKRGPATTRSRRTPAETVALATRIKAERPALSEAELAAELGISLSRWRTVRREATDREMAA